MSNRTGLVWHERYMWHMTGIAGGSIPAGGFVEPDLLHVESAPAKRRIRNLLEVSGLLDDLSLIRPRPATEAEVLRVHSKSYFDRLAGLSDVGFGDAGEWAPVGRDSLPIALLAAGGCIAALDAILDRKIQNAYALVRPPGHHAERERGRGFCLLANASIAIEHARAAHGLRRIALVDWDVHHGNGAQSIFYADPGVLTISLHQDGFYPAESGSREERGEGAGWGANINVPLPPGSGHGAYLAVLDKVVLPALERFRPELILVSSGLDCSAFDPFGRQMATAETFRQMTRRVMSAADRLCGGRLLLLHEGGYSTFYAPWCGLAIVEELSGIKTEADDPYAFAIDWPGQTLQPAQELAIDAAAAMIREIPLPP